MRVLITRPEREATTFAQALAERGHVPVIAPLFQLHVLRPPEGFDAALVAAQAILITSANGARALAEATEQRSKPIVAVGDTTAATAEGLGFTSVMSAAGDGAALTELVQQRLDATKGPLLHVSGVDVAGELAPEGFEVLRFALYQAREVEKLPESARAALEARALDAATFFSPRASAVFAKLVDAAGLGDTCRAVAAIAISEAAGEPLQSLPFKSTLVAHRPTRQAVLDEIDRLAEAVVQGTDTMSDTDTSTATPPSPAPPPTQVRSGLGVLGAFIVGLIAAAIVLGGALVSLPYWPEEARLLWRGTPPAHPPAQSIDTARLRAEAVAAAGQQAQAALETARRELNARLDDLDKRVRAAAATAAQADRPVARDPAIAELRGRIEALEKRPPTEATPAPGAGPSPETEREVAALKSEIASLRAALGALDQALAGQKEAIEKARTAASARGEGEQKAVAAARASAVIGIAARLNAALEAGLPFAADLALLAPFTKSDAGGDAKVQEAVAALQPLANAGVASPTTLAADFPAVAKAALADDVADDSFGERILGKIKGIVSLRRVGADVQGDSTEARLARAEAAADAGDLAKAVELVKSLPPQTTRATSAWLARAEAQLAARRAVDQLAAHAVSQLGAAR